MELGWTEWLGWVSLLPVSLPGSGSWGLAERQSLLLAAAEAHEGRRKPKAS